MYSHHSHSATVITVLNLKGGVGKTHAAWLIAAVADERRKKLLLVDTDSQGNLTSSFLTEPSRTFGVERLFDPADDPEPASLIQKTAFPHIDLIPGGPTLAPFDLSKQADWEQTELQFALAQAVEGLRPQYDLILFDCPPRLSLVSFAALCASDFVIIPLEAAEWGAQGIMQVTAAIEYVQQRFNPRLRLLGYLISRFKKARSYHRAYLTQLRQHFGPAAFDTSIPDLAGFEKSVIDRVPITRHAPGSPEAAIARAFFAEVERRIAEIRGGSNALRRQDLPEAAALAA